MTEHSLVVKKEGFYMSITLNSERINIKGINTKTNSKVTIKSSLDAYIDSYFNGNYITDLLQFDALFDVLNKNNKIDSYHKILLFLSLCLISTNLGEDIIEKFDVEKMSIDDSLDETNICFYVDHIIKYQKQCLEKYYTVEYFNYNKFKKAVK